MQVRKQQLEMDMEQLTGSKLGKEYIKDVYCHCAYLTYMQSTSWETLKAMLKSNAQVLDGHEFEQGLGVGDGQGSLVCCSPWGRKELEVTKRLNPTEQKDPQLSGKMQK